jgi:tetrahydromethanopterin S-methyltransferase subunit G
MPITTALPSDETTTEELKEELEALKKKVSELEGEKEKKFGICGPTIVLLIAMVLPLLIYSRRREA